MFHVGSRIVKLWNVPEDNEDIEQTTKQTFLEKTNSFITVSLLVSQIYYSNNISLKINTFHHI